jgi:hypothetical protein
MHVHLQAKQAEAKLIEFEASLHTLLLGMCTERDHAHRLQQKLVEDLTEANTFLKVRRHLRSVWTCPRYPDHIEFKTLFTYCKEPSEDHASSTLHLLSQVHAMTYCAGTAIDSTDADGSI